MAKQKLIGLAAIVAGMNVDPQFVWVGKEEVAELAIKGLVEVNDQIADPQKKGRLATRATQKGIDLNAQTAQAPAATGDAQKVKPVFKLDSGIEIPAALGRGRGPGESIYPFGDMEVGQSFFIEKEPTKLASTISSANARFSVAATNEDGSPKTRTNKKGKVVPAKVKTRTFIVRGVTENGVKGSRIWRKA